MESNTQGKPCVLVVDDSKLVRHSAKKILADDFTVLLAEDGEEGWQQINDNPDIQVVFTDLGMPKLDGYGLIQKVRTADSEAIRHLPMIVITGADDLEEIKRKVFEVGATDFINKPFTATAILARANAHATYRNTAQSLKEQANIDLVTGMLNRQGFEQQLKKDLSFIARHKEPIALASIEIHDFDNLFEKIGEKTADQLLKKIADLINASVRKEDSVARYGSARFTVSLPMAKVDGVVKLARRVAQQINSISIKLRDESINVRVSAGICAVAKGASYEVAQVIQTSEEALNNAIGIGDDVQILRLEDTATESIGQAGVSIDELIDCVNRGELEQVSAQLDQAIITLQPLFSLMNDAQKKACFG